MKIGIYYPSGHSVLDRATEQFRHHLAMVAGNKPSIRFTLQNNNLYLQGISLDKTHFFVREFKETLTSLTIKYLDIDREISSPEVHTFIKSLLAYRAKFKSTKQFVQINLGELPCSVRIAQADFLSSETQLDGTDEASPGSQPTLEAFLESLNQQGLTKEQMKQCRQLLETASSSSLLFHNEKKVSSFITWSDVERLILNLVKQSGTLPGSKEKAHSQRDLNALASILQTLGKGTTDKNSIEAINLLVSLVKKSSQEPTSPEKKNGQKAKGKEKNDGLKVSDIEHYINENRANYPLSKTLSQSNRHEILTIAMQLLEHKHPLQTQVRIQQIIRDILTTPLGDEEWQIISNGINQLLQNTTSKHLPITLMMIIDPLRRSQHVSSLALFEQVSRNCISVELKTLLPYLINEILIVGSQDNPEIFNELCNMALFLPPSDSTEALPVLKKLDAFMEAKIAPNLFFSMSPTNYPLFAPLLNTSIGELLAKRIIQGFFNKSPGWIIEALLPLLDSTQSLHRKFLYEFLKNSRFSEPTSTTKSLAGDIIVQTLPAITEEKRKDFALIKTIKAMPQLKGTSLRKVLESIAYKRHLLVIPEWPAHCRKAAREALSVLQTQKTSAKK